MIGHVDNISSKLTRLSSVAFGGRNSTFASFVVLNIEDSLHVLSFLLRLVCSAASATFTASGCPVRLMTGTGNRPTSPTNSDLEASEQPKPKLRVNI